MSNRAGECNRSLGNLNQSHDSATLCSPIVKQVQEAAVPCRSHNSFLRGEAVKESLSMKLHQTGRNKATVHAIVKAHRTEHEPSTSSTAKTVNASK